MDVIEDFVFPIVSVGSFFVDAHAVKPFNVRSEAIVITKKATSMVPNKKALNMRLPPAENRKIEKILLVEDDRDISALVARYLAENGFATMQAFDSRDVEAMLAAHAIDLIVLDINLPTEDGLSLCVRLRRSSRIPIIMLTARSEEVDRILGLEIGADDYVTKPFNPRELLARIRAVLRRRDGPPEPVGRELTFIGWRIDLLSRRVRNADGSEVALSGAEFELLLILCENAGRVLTRERLLELTRNSASGRSIDIVVSRLRRKIEDDPRDPLLIKTVRSGGYFFAAPVQTIC